MLTLFKEKYLNWKIIKKKKKTLVKRINNAIARRPLID